MTGADLDVEAGLLLISRRAASTERLAELDRAARQRPLALPRLVRALDDQHARPSCTIDRADADDRLLGISRAPLTFPSRS